MVALVGTQKVHTRVRVGFGGPGLPHMPQFLHGVPATACSEVLRKRRWRSNKVRGGVYQSTKIPVARMKSLMASVASRVGQSMQGI